MKYHKGSYKFYLHKNNKNDKEGYIYLQKIYKRKKSRTSLHLPKIKEVYWNSTTERVRERKEIDYQLFNDTIDQKVKNLTSTLEDQLNYNKERKPFISFFKKYIDSTKLKHKHGTRIKYQSVLNKLISFLTIREVKDLSFFELDIDFISDFQEYLKTEGLETNTSTHYLKIIRSIIRKSHKKGYSFKDPFIEFTFEKKQKKIKEYLTKKEIQKIRNTEIRDKRLNKIKTIFLFQILSKGMRISDILTMRYNNLCNGELAYFMFKTKNQANFKLTLLHTNLLKEFIEFKIDISKLTLQKKDIIIDGELEKFKKLLKKNINAKPKLNIRPIRKSPIKNHLSIKSYIPLLFFLYGKPYKYNHFSKKQKSLYEYVLKGLTLYELQDELSKLKKIKKNKGNIKFTNRVHLDGTEIYKVIKDFLDPSINVIENNIKSIYKSYFDKIIEELHRLGTGKDKNNFVFGLLSNEEFDNIDAKNDFSLISEDQYRRINKTSIVYNRNLKKLQKLSGINKNLKSHLPRISYTNLMWNIDGVDTYDIMSGLNHSSIQITAAYLETGFRKDRTDEIHKKFNDDLIG